MKRPVFKYRAFEQPGQLAMAEEESMTDHATKPLRKHTIFEPCERHALMLATESRRRCAEVMVEGGYASSPCIGDRCRMRPGTDLFNAGFVTSYPLYGIGDDQ